MVHFEESHVGQRGQAPAAGVEARPEEDDLGRPGGADGVVDDDGAYRHVLRRRPQELPGEAQPPLLSGHVVASPVDRLLFARIEEMSRDRVGKPAGQDPAIRDSAGLRHEHRRTTCRAVGHTGGCGSY